MLSLSADIEVVSQVVQLPVCCHVSSKRVSIENGSLLVAVYWKYLILVALFFRGGWYVGR